MEIVLFGLTLAFIKTYGFLNENSVGSSTKMTTSQKLIIILSKLIKTL